MFQALPGILPKIESRKFLGKPRAVVKHFPFVEINMVARGLRAAKFLDRKVGSNFITFNGKLESERTSSVCKGTHQEKSEHFWHFVNI